MTILRVVFRAILIPTRVKRQAHRRFGVNREGGRGETGEGDMGRAVLPVRKAGQRPAQGGRKPGRMHRLCETMGSDQGEGSGRGSVELLKRLNSVNLVALEDASPRARI